MPLNLYPSPLALDFGLTPSGTVDLDALAVRLDAAPWFARLEFHALAALSPTIAFDMGVGRLGINGALAAPHLTGLCASWGFLKTNLTVNAVAPRVRFWELAG